ncbi:MAG: hypothetical protein PHI88_03010 [Candidatus Pacebacteria bacterium]|nr:hypothetical protein [Candidatus Paceibacterota bacterium]
MGKDNIIFLHSFRTRNLNPDLKEAVEEMRKRLREISEKIASSMGKEGNEEAEKERLSRFLGMYVELHELVMEIPEKIQSPKELGAMIQILCEVSYGLFEISEELRKEGESLLEGKEGG